MVENTESSLPQTRKRKARTGATPNAQHKRAQNRLSQRCLRERSFAETRARERLSQARVAVANSAADGAQHAILMKEHIELLDQNQRLQDALFRLRKKLFSLSNAATATAEDPIFNDLLAKVPEQQEDGWNQPNMDLQPHPSANNLPQDCAILVRSPGPSVEQLTVPGTDVSFPHHHAATPHSGFAVPAGSIPLRRDFQESDLGVASPGGVLYQTLDWTAIPASLTFIPQDLSITSGKVFAEKLVNACRFLAARHETSMLADRDKKIAAAAVSFFSKCCGLETYVYGLNGAKYIEQILKWKIGFEGKDCVSAPFRPTPLQSKSTVHHLGVDLIHWPDIRDQILLEASSIDLDIVIPDLVLHSVIEQPNRGIAFNVYDLFQNQIVPRKSGEDSFHVSHGSCLTQPGWVYLDLASASSKLCSDGTLDPVEEAIAAELRERIMSNLDSSCIRQPWDGSSLTTGPGESRAFIGQDDVAIFLGLDKMSQWRLSKEFADKYPFFDCSSALAAYDMVPASQVCCW